MSFSINTLSVILGCAAGIIAFLSIRNPMASLMVGLAAFAITETVTRLQGGSE